VGLIIEIEAGIATVAEDETATVATTEAALAVLVALTALVAEISRTSTPLLRQ